MSITQTRRLQQEEAIQKLKKIRLKFPSISLGINVEILDTLTDNKFYFTSITKATKYLGVKSGFFRGE
jgi:hypothetical protein